MSLITACLKCFSSNSQRKQDKLASLTPLQPPPPHAPQLSTSIGGGGKGKGKRKTHCNLNLRECPQYQSQGVQVVQQLNIGLFFFTLCLAFACGACSALLLGYAQSEPASTRKKSCAYQEGGQALIQRSKPDLHLVQLAQVLVAQVAMLAIGYTQLEIAQARSN